MAIQSGSESDEVVSDINVTPLVDVMLVLLVVFIVTAPLLTNAVKINLPQTSANAPLEVAKAVTISVDAGGKIFVDRGEIALSELSSELRSRRAGHPELAVHLSADGASNYGIVAKVMSEVDRAGVTKLSVLTLNE
ncbi:MAG TPA: biopolymer transporter ExbD [Polyangiaceae bacterium]|jgi:biopolymer transport protein ExbD|nr:biopolymer transporter ExbD [Polyangiaceae bacterium]